MRIASLAKRNMSYSGYRNKLARKRGFSSYNEYQKKCSRKRREKNLTSIIFGTMIRTHLERLNMTQIEASKKIGVNRIVFGNWYVGSTFPSKKYHSKISDTLELSREDLDVWVSELEQKVQDGKTPRETYQVYRANKNEYYNLETALEMAKTVIDKNELLKWVSLRNLKNMGYVKLANAILRKHGVNKFKRLMNEEYF